MADIKVEALNAVYMKILAPADISMELHDYFSFFIPGHKFNPKVRAGLWDGKIRLFNIGKRTLYRGLWKKLKEYADNNGYTIEADFETADKEVDLHTLKEFIKDLHLPFTPHDHQLKALRKAVRKERLTIVSPTSSGKSLVIHMLAQWYQVKTLIIVPTISLVNQLANDLEEYGCEEEIHRIMGGREKYSEERLTISTWQSIYKMPAEFFHQFDMVIVDECHQAKAASLSGILEKCTANLRFGLTGTLDDGKTKCNPMVITGLLGEEYRPVTTRELMDKGLVSDLRIKCLVLNYTDEEKKACRKFTYQEEIDYLCASPRRNRFILNLVRSLDGNTIILFNYIEKHGRVLERLFREVVKDRPIYWVSGATDVEEREEIRQIVNKESNAILLGSRGAIGTGTDIRNLHNLVFASPTKAKIQTLQNIGRVLRKSATKTRAVLYDIADDLSWKSKRNYTLNHFFERAKVYDEEQFSYKVYEIGLK